LSVRYNWAADYRGSATIVYGHTPIPQPEWLNRTINIDTGCVFGGKLTALRYPEKEIVSVPAREIYYAPAKPFQAATSVTSPDGANALTAQQETGINSLVLAYLNRLSDFLFIAARWANKDAGRDEPLWRPGG